jgi:hypothetical protein
MIDTKIEPTSSFTMLDIDLPFFAIGFVEDDFVIKYDQGALEHWKKKLNSQELFTFTLVVEAGFARYLKELRGELQ